MHTLAFSLFLSFLLSVSPAPCRLILNTLSLTSEATFGGCCLIIRLCLSENITFLDSFDFSFVSQLEERFPVIRSPVTRRTGGKTPGARKVKVQTQRLLRCSFSLDCERCFSFFIALSVFLLALRQETTPLVKLVCLGIVWLLLMLHLPLLLLFLLLPLHPISEHWPEIATRL